MPETRIEIPRDALCDIRHQAHFFLVSDQNTQELMMLFSVCGDQRVMLFSVRTRGWQYYMWGPEGDAILCLWGLEGDAIICLYREGDYILCLWGPEGDNIIYMWGPEGDAILCLWGLERVIIFSVCEDQRVMILYVRPKGWWYVRTRRWWYSLSVSTRGW